jgi:hypothetical protein
MKTKNKKNMRKTKKINLNLSNEQELEFNKLYSNHPLHSLVLEYAKNGEPEQKQNAMKIVKDLLKIYNKNFEFIGKYPQHEELVKQSIIGRPNEKKNARKRINELLKISKSYSLSPNEIKIKINKIIKNL